MEEFSAGIGLAEPGKYRELMFKNLTAGIAIICIVKTAYYFQLHTGESGGILDR
jgi:hypothetical protein